MRVLEREEIESVATRTTARAYILLYRKLSNYYTDPDRVKECHAKILKLTEKLTDCEPTTCSYHTIGNACYSARNYKDGAYFMELSLQQAKHQDEPITEVSLLYKLREANLKLDNTVKAEENLAEMIALQLHPRLMSTPAASCASTHIQIYCRT